MIEHKCETHAIEATQAARRIAPDIGSDCAAGATAADWSTIGRFVLVEAQRRTRDELLRREEAWRPAPLANGEVLS